MRNVLLMACLLLAGLAGCIEDGGDGYEQTDDVGPIDGRGDATVVAIIDSGFNPYHWNFLAQYMPQHLDEDPENDLPLWDDPATWLPGHPGADAFASYDALRLTLTPDDPDAVPTELRSKDAEAWDAVPASGIPDDIHMRWIPGTKVIGVVTGSAGGGFSPSSHGVGTSSVSVGNIHGTCPSCLILFVNGLSDEAVSWVAQQDWIDVQSNSWGYSTVATEKVYTQCDQGTQRAGVERGQQIFFSGGNGMANAFDAPVPTLYSCQKASDWIVTVGANTHEGATFTGSGKPVDVANIGTGYPSQGGATVTAEGTFSGTSNAAPTTAGLYAQALYDIRHALDGPSRMQQDGIIARGPAGCGEANPECALGDGNLTVHELRHALFAAARLQAHGIAAVAQQATVPITTAEWALMSEGHGSFFGHIGDPKEEVARIVQAADGTVDDTLAPDVAAFAKAVSYCTQQVWGIWDHGAWTGETLSPDPEWPLRTWLHTLCPDTISAIAMVADQAP